jgi:hypothetical protein
MAASNAWGDRWQTGDERIPVIMHHTACGRDTPPQVVCSSCGEPLHHEDMAVRIGPGYPDGCSTTRQYARFSAETNAS